MPQYRATATRGDRLRAGPAISMAMASYAPGTRRENSLP